MGGGSVRAAVRAAVEGGGHTSVTTRPRNIPNAVEIKLEPSRMWKIEYRRHALGSLLSPQVTPAAPKPTLKPDCDAK